MSAWASALEVVAAPTTTAPDPKPKPKRARTKVPGPWRLESARGDAEYRYIEGKVGTGLGTQIVRTLIQGELGGTIDWHTLEGEGTEVTIEVPTLWMDRT